MSTLSAEERAELATSIEASILNTISKLGYRNGSAIQAALSAGKMVAQRVEERKPLKTPRT